MVGKLELFHSIFVGREDVCAMLNPRGHFEPCCRNAGNVGLCQRPVGACAKCKSQSFEPFGKDAAGKHMLGDGVYGTYPILPDGTCKYVVAEFAGPNWVEDACSYRDECESLNLAPALERDSSGNAGHVWLFFAIPVSCESARKLASSILALAMEKRHITSLYPYNRIFPSQDTAPEDGFGRVLAMPLQGAVKKDGNSLFLDSSFAAYPDQLEHLSCLAKVTPEDIERICNGKELGVASQKPLTVGLDVPETVHALKSEGLVIPKDGLSERALNRIIWLAAFENPDFLKAQALMMDVSKRKRVISTALESESSICLPVGAESAFLEMLKDAKSNCEIDDNRKTGAPIEENIKVSLTREQLDALNELIKADVGILRAPPAFKETLVAAAIIARKKVSTLILVTRIARLWHWVVSLQNCLKTSIGSSIIGDVSLGGDIDVALAPSLIERGRVIEKAKSYGMILVDECHLAYKEPLRSILMQSGAKHVYGFTSKPVAHKFCGEVLCHAGSSNQTARVFVPRFTSLIAHEDFHESTFREHWWSSHVTGFEVELKQKCLKRLDLEGNKERSELVIQDAEKAVKSRKIPLIAA
ncbi:MAG: hypothetical protein LBT59_26935, partial [Clostridiales bacterium]|nr:hypothetical protein [Clostridiales bacterium]